MVIGEIRLIKVDMSDSSHQADNNYVLGRIVGLIAANIHDEEMIYLRILGSSKCPERYSIKILATDEEWEYLAKSLKESIATDLAEIRFYNVKSETEEES